MALCKQRWVAQIGRESLKPWIHLFGCKVSYTHSLAEEGEGCKEEVNIEGNNKFVDRFELAVRAGGGGKGCTSLRKFLRSNRQSIPDGGDGGNGGNIILQCAAGLWDFSHLYPFVDGNCGAKGNSKKRAGNRGKDKILQLPIGTVIHFKKGSIPPVKESTTLLDTATWTDDEEEVEVEKVTSQNASISEPIKDRILGNNSTIASCATSLAKLHSANASDCTSTSKNPSDSEHHLSSKDHCHIGAPNRVFSRSTRELYYPGECILVASGGRGGRGNAAIREGSGRGNEPLKAEHEPGQPGSEAVLSLELKTIADVGILGASYAGKSTLLGALSQAKPKIGHSAFNTTPRPNIGRIVFDDYCAITVIDIPGLIQDAHEDTGLGMSFLRNIENTRTIAYVVDLSASLGDSQGIPPWDQLEQLKRDLQKYQTRLSNQPSLIVASKVDECGAEEVLTELKRRWPLMQVYPVCSVSGEGIRALKWGLRMLVEDLGLDAHSLLQ